MIRVTRRYEFSASHRLHAPGLTEEENGRLYGKCNNPFGHGHNYVLEVSVRGPVDPRSGRAVDPTKIDGLVRERVAPERILGASGEVHLTILLRSFIYGIRGVRCSGWQFLWRSGAT